MKRKQKKILYMFLSIMGLQLLRMLFKTFAFYIVQRTLISDMMVNILFVSIMLFFVYRYLKKKKTDINLLPKKLNKYYLFTTIILVLFMIFTIYITKSYTVYSILAFIYNAIFTVVYEEIIFRGIIYKEVENLYNEKYAFIISTILFGIWHLGYIDSIIWRTSFFFNSTNIGKIMLLKVITGMVLGVIFAFLRKKYKNVYSSSLMHALINTFRI